jgi:hypothetical protein
MSSTGITFDIKLCYDTTYVEEDIFAVVKEVDPFQGCQPIAMVE